MIDVTSLVCPNASVEGATHYLYPKRIQPRKSRHATFVLICAYCGKTETQIREGNAHGNKSRN